ncbi:MAG TPA: queuosine salvage family protein [Ktedonobacteraceae bacterium]|nr:queuosine salvage family protein [Ktedonobacteraceae bacterium]
MAEVLRRYESEEEEIFPLYETDQSGILSSTRHVLEEGEHVWIDQERLEQLAFQWVQQEGNGAALYTPVWYDQYHFHDGTERTVNWLLLLDALNFCFWAEKGQPRWQIEYKGDLLNGYWAEAAALTRAVEEGMPLWDATYLCNISSEDLAHIFRGGPASPPIPLFEQRLQIAREVGQVLIEQYNGQFSHAIEQVEYDAVKLALLLAMNFSSFNDVAQYRKHEVRFLKRAQICVADLHGSFGGKDWGALHNLDSLTAFADYKLPQVLRHLGVLVYERTLAGRIDNQELLPPGSEEEIELRAATVWACELLRRAMAGHDRHLTATEIDQRLWLLGQESTHMRPYHRTRTIFY